MLYRGNLFISTIPGQRNCRIKNQLAKIINSDNDTFSGRTKVKEKVLEEVLVAVFNEYKATIYSNNNGSGAQ